MFGQILSNKNEKVLYLQYRPEFGGAESDTELNVAQVTFAFIPFVAQSRLHLVPYHQARKES